MTNSNPNPSKPAPLYTSNIPLGMDLEAEVVIDDIGPEDAPTVGSDWNIEIDYPRIRLSIRLGNGSSYLPAALRNEELQLLGERLHSSWGNCGRRWVEISGPSVRACVSALRSRAEAELAPLIAHVAARAARLAQRERTLEAARAL